MKKQRSWYRIICTLLVVFVSLTSLFSCSTKNEANRDFSNSGSAEKYYPPISDKESDIGIGALPDSGATDPDAKIIKTATASLKTKEYDKTLELIMKKIGELEGYLDYESYSGSSPYRYASMTARIPAGKLDEFKNSLPEIATLTHYDASKDDVTVAYAMLVARIDTLTLEIKVVSDLFEVAKVNADIEKIADLEKRLTELKLELAESNAALSAYDNDIAYSTVYLSISEIRNEELNEEKLGAFARIGNNLIKNITDIANFFVELFIFSVSSLPYLLLIGAVAFIVIFVIVKCRTKKRTENDQKDEEK